MGLTKGASELSFQWQTDTGLFFPDPPASDGGRQRMVVGMILSPGTPQSPADLSVSAAVAAVDGLMPSAAL
jgi:hypothetical protein